MMPATSRPIRTATYAMNSVVLNDALVSVERRRDSVREAGADSRAPTEEPVMALMWLLLDGTESRTPRAAGSPTASIRPRALRAAQPRCAERSLKLPAVLPAKPAGRGQTATPRRAPPHARALEPVPARAPAARTAPSREARG